MDGYMVTDKNGNTIKKGDRVTNFRGKVGTFECATRPPSPGKSGKIVVDGFESYAECWGLIVTPA